MNRIGLEMIEAESLDQVRGQCVYPMVSEEYREAFKSLTQDVFKGRSGTLEFKMIGLKGRPLWLFTKAVPLRNEKGQIVLSLSVTIDITERKEMEEALQKNEERYRRITEAITDYIYTVRVENRRPVETRHSEACVAVTGFTSREFAEDPYLWIKMVSEEDHDLVREQAEEVLSGKTPDPIEHRIIRKNGSMRWVESAVVPHYDMNGTLISYDGIVRDITERRIAEEALLASEKKCRDLLENIQLIAVLLDLKGNITFCNDYFLRLTGWSRDEALNRNWFDMFLPEDVKGYGKSVFRANITRGTILHNENPIITRQGVLRQIVWDIAVLHDSDGNVTGTAGIGIDVTEHRMLEEQLRQAQKMEAIGHLAGGIAHDFNNILSAIVGYAHLTLMKMKDNDPLRINIEHILASSGRAASLIQSLLAFSRKQIILLKLVDINEILYDIKTILCRIIGEDIDFKTDTAVKRLIVKADKSQIEQALMNLATNARDAMPHGGTLTISAEEVEINGRFIQMHQFGEPGRYAVITVADTGVGMDEKTKKNIFEPFFTTKEVGKGTGLGLAMVYGTIKQHNGYINVYSEPGKGTTFKIYLPLEGPGEQPAEKKGASTVSAGTETILLVEDEEIVRAIMRSLLEESGYTVLEATDGEDGLRLFKENRGKINLVLSDIIMPKMQGREMYEEIKKIAPDIKILFISGYPADFIDQKSFSEKGKNIIDKPVIPDELLRKIREVLDN